MGSTLPDEMLVWHTSCQQSAAFCHTSTKGPQNHQILFNFNVKYQQIANFVVKNGTKHDVYAKYALILAVHNGRPPATRDVGVA